MNPAHTLCGGTPMSLSDAVDARIACMSTGGDSAAARIVSALKRLPIASLDITAMTTADMDAARDWLVAYGYAPGTVMTWLSTLRSLLRFAGAAWSVPVPFQVSQYSTSWHEEPWHGPVPADVFDAWVATIESPPLQALIVLVAETPFSLYSGLPLNASDFSASRRRLQVHGSWADPAESLHLSERATRHLVAAAAAESPGQFIIPFARREAEIRTRAAARAAGLGGLSLEVLSRVGVARQGGTSDTVTPARVPAPNPAPMHNSVSPHVPAPAAVAAGTSVRACRWWCSAEGTWVTSCGHTPGIATALLHAAGADFCCYCGGHIEASATDGDNDGGGARADSRNLTP